MPEAFEYVERARGHLDSFHQLMGRADVEFANAAQVGGRFTERRRQPSRPRDVVHSRKMLQLLRASHIQPVVAVTAIATALAVAAHQGLGSATVAGAVAAGQLTVGWSNDYLDRDRDLKSGRLDKPLVAGAVEAITVRRCAIAAAVACVPLSLLLGWQAGALHVAAVSVAMSYNVGLKATRWSPLPYILSFGSLPAVITLSAAGHPLPPWWAVGGAALLGCGAHFINTLADADTDRVTNVRGLPQRFGPRASLWVGVGLLGLSAATLALGPTGPMGKSDALLLIAAWSAALGVAWAQRVNNPRVAWSLTLVTAVIVVALLIANGRSLIP